MLLGNKRVKRKGFVSDLEKMVVIIGNGHYGREDSEFGNSVTKPKSLSYVVFLIELTLELKRD